MFENIELSPNEYFEKVEELIFQYVQCFILLFIFWIGLRKCQYTLNDNFTGGINIRMSCFRFRVVFFHKIRYVSITHYTVENCVYSKTISFSSTNFLRFIMAYRILPKAVLILTFVFSAISLKLISR